MKPDVHLIIATICAFILICLVWLPIDCSSDGESVAIAATAQTSDKANGTQVTLGILVHADVQPDQKVFGDLLQVALSKHPDIATLERQAIDAVINEIQFSLFFADNGPGKRIDAGSLLDAEALVLVRSSATNRGSLSVAVVETRSGIRLLTHTIAADTDLQQAADALIDLIEPRLARINDPAQQFIAVPTFVDKRLVRADRELGARLAELARSRLDRESKLQLIEVSDADALSHELKLRGDKRLGPRGTPFYLLGEIDSEPTDPNTLNISLRIERSSQVLSQRSVKALSPSEAGVYCLETLPELLNEVAGLQVGQIQTQEENIRLLNRSQTFLRAGDKRQAVELLQVAHLLEPDNPAITGQSLKLMRHVVWHILFDEASGRPIEERANAALDLYLAGLEQVSQELEASLFAPSSRRRKAVHMQQIMDYLIFGDQKFVLRYYYRNVTNTELGEKVLAEQIRPKVFAARRALRDAMLIKLKMLAEAGDVKGRETDMAWFFVDAGKYGETQEQEAAWRFEALKALQDADDLERVTRWLLHAQSVKDRPVLAEVVSSRLNELTPKASAFVENFIEKNLSSKPVTPSRSHPNELTVDWDALIPLTKEKLELRVTDRQRGGAGRVRPKGWFDCGKFGELVWHDTEVFLITAPDTIRSLYVLDPDEHYWLDPTRQSELCTPAFDGRYVWTALPIDEPKLIIIDPTDGTAHTFSQDAGLPPMDGGVSVAPLGPGRALVTASFGTWHNLRAWSAIVTYTPNEPVRVDVFREATSFADQADVPKGLRPLYTGESVALTDPNDPNNFVILVDQPNTLDRSRHILTHKLMILPNEKRFRLWYSRDGISEGLIFTTLIDGKLYCAGRVDRTGEPGAHIMSFDMKTLKMRPERRLRSNESFLSAAKHDGLYWVLGRSNRYDMTLFAGKDLLNAYEPVGILGNTGLYYETIDKLYASRYLGLIFLSDIGGGYDVTRIIPPSDIKQRLGLINHEQENQP